MKTEIWKERKYKIVGKEFRATPTERQDTKFM